METNSFDFFQDDIMQTSFASFEVMKRKGELIDFKVTIQNRSFFAHRLVMAAGIPYFRSIFASFVTEIPIDGIDPDVFEGIINFAYSGKIKITMGNVEALLTASQLLQLNQVHEACVKFMSVKLNVSNVFQMRAFAGNNRSLRLAAACDLFILRNFQEFSCEKLMEFFQLPFPYLKEILSRDDLNALKEEIVFEAVIKWVLACPAERHVLLPELLCSVRMTQFSTRYLVERVSTEKLILTSPPCKYLIEQTKNYHLLHRDSRSSLDSTGTCTRNTNCHGLYAICFSRLGHFLELYDIVKGVWITLAKVRDEVKSCVAGYNGKFYFFRKNATEIEAFDVRTFKMEKVTTSQSTLIPKESVQQVVLHNNKFYIFTGSRMYCFDPQEKKWLGLKTSLDCNESGIASLGQYIYVTGGYIKPSTTNVCKRYNSTSESLYSISPMLEKRGEHGCAALNNMVYVCGGSFDDGAEVYDPLTDRWSYLSPKKSLPFTCSVVSFKGKLYAIGRDVLKSACEIYDPKTREWIEGFRKPSCCNHLKYVAIPPQYDDKGCPEFSDLRLQLRTGFSTGL